MWHRAAKTHSDLLDVFKFQYTRLWWEVTHTLVAKGPFNRSFSQKFQFHNRYRWRLIRRRKLNSFRGCGKVLVNIRSKLNVYLFRNKRRWRQRRFQSRLRFVFENRWNDFSAEKAFVPRRSSTMERYAYVQRNVRIVRYEKDRPTSCLGKEWPQFTLMEDNL